MSISRATLSQIRFGYGLRPDARSPDPDTLVMALGHRDPAAPDGPGIADRLALLIDYGAARKASGGERSSDVRRLRQSLRDLAAQDFRSALAAPLTSPDGFRERLVAFWADHFTVSAKNVRLAAVVAAHRNEAIRPHVAGSFADMLVASSTHPAMLAYLDQNSSFGPTSPAGRRRGKGLNENLAREILELHTLGVGAAYGQDDVRQFAELLTGLSLDANGFSFNPRRAEPGSETVLGKAYGGGRARLDDIIASLRDLAVHPATAAHLAHKLAVHFVADDPDRDLVAHMEAAWTSSRGDLRTVYGAMLEHPAAWRPELAKVKQPWDFVVSTLRAFGLSAGDLDALGPQALNKGLAQPMQAMGQAPFRAPGPDGWPEAADAWITPATLTARIDWAVAMARRHGDAIDPRAFVEATLADAAPDRLRLAAAGAETRWEGVAVVLAAPAFNRR